MRRGGPPPEAHKSAVSAGNSAATTPRSAAPSGSQRSLSTGAHGTILINLDVFIHRANIGRDISPDDDDLIVLFRRNSKEVTSEPAHWSAEHSAVWNQHVDIQTSLLRQKKPQGSAAAAAEFLKKEYEIVLVALPSHSAVALFSVDFATLVQPNALPHDRRKFFRVSPLKCRDLAATLEFEITWDLVSSSDSSPATSGAPVAAVAGLPPSSMLPAKGGTTPKAQTPRSRERNRSRRVANDAPSVPNRRTTASLSSAGSENDGLEEASALNCSNCRSAKRRLDRKEVQVLQLESFLKESQKRIDALSTENEELVVREKAETRNAVQQRALNLRLLQELETAVLLCNEQMHLQDTTLLPQVELIERVKKFHEEADVLRGHESAHSVEAALGPESQPSLDYRAETEAALQRNQRLQEQLEFVGRSMDYDSEAVEGGTRTHRAATDASGTTISSVRSGSVTLDLSERPVALTMTQQLNNLERENFKLRAELEGALANVASALKKHSGGYPSGFASGPSLTAEVSETTSSSSREDIEETEHDDAALLSRIREQHEVEAGRVAALESELATAKGDVETLKQQLESAQNGCALKTDQEQPAQASGFLDKMYADVGKAKLALEDRVNELDEMLASATEENGRLRDQIEEFQAQKSDSDDHATVMETKTSICELERLLEVRGKELEGSKAAVASLKIQLEDAARRARAGESTKAELESELAGVRLSLKMARESILQLENQLAVMSCSAAGATTSTSFISRNSTTSDAVGHDHLADVQKQLKLSKQEVMQLRFRSNQLESVNERLEETLKEKRTLEVKLTALEGQLFEQRSRTINSDNNSFIAPSLDAKTSAMLAEMQRELDQKSAQLMIAEQDLEHLRSRVDGRSGEGSSAPSNMDDVAHQVKCFESEIACLCERNDEQARRLKRLGNRVTVAIRERDELEAIVQQMVTEMSLLGKDVKFPVETGANRSVSVCENDETEKAPSPMSRLASPSISAQAGKITDRYANAVASSSSHTTSSCTPTVSSKVAQLMKNFSA